MSDGTDDKQKVSSEHVGNPELRNVEGFDVDGELLHPDVRESAEKKLVRKLDMRLMPTIIIIFLMNYIDVSDSIYCSWSTKQAFPSERPLHLQG
jgi:hypothetical protein